MKKGLRFICLIVVLVILATLLVSCSLFQLNDERYRAQELATMPNGTVVTLGQFIDFMNNNASSYLSNSNYDRQEVWDYFYSMFINQMIIVDDYIFAYKKVYSNSLKAGLVKYSEYLTDDDILYYVNNIILSLYSSLDTEAETYLNEKGFSFDTAPSEPTATTKTEIEEDSIYMSGYTRDLEKIDKALEKYNPILIPSSEDFEIDYVFEAGNEKLIKKVTELNKRIKSDSEKKLLTQQDYIAAQKSALSVLTRNVSTNYSISLQSFVFKQLEQMFVQELYNKWMIIQSKELYDSIISSGKLDVYLQETLKAQQEKYALDPTTFTTFATALSNTTFVLDIPQLYQNRYAEISNIVMPFNAEQSAQLTAWKKLGLSTEEYNALRNQLALQIVAIDFYSEVNYSNEFDKVVDFKQMFINYLDSNNDYAMRRSYFIYDLEHNNYVANDFLANNIQYLESFDTYINSDNVYKSNSNLSHFIDSNTALMNSFNTYLTGNSLTASAQTRLDFINSNIGFVNSYTAYLKENTSYEFVTSTTDSDMTASYNEYLTENWANASLLYIESDKTVSQNYYKYLFNTHTAQQETAFISSNESVSYAFSKFGGTATEFVNLLGLNNETYFQYLYHVYLVDTYEGNANSNINNTTFLQFFDDCLYRYNTDQGGYNKAYSYVIDKYVPNKSYVPEFADAAMVLANGKDGDIDFVITDYGIHIIMKKCDLKVDTFTDKSFGSGAGTNYYRLLKMYYDAVKSQVIDKDLMKMYNDKIGNVTVNKSALKMFANVLGVSIEKKETEE